MASNWSFLRAGQQNEQTKGGNYLVLAFIVLQVILFVLIAATIAQFNQNNAPDDDATIYKKLPELTIANLKDKAPYLTDTEIQHLQKQIFQTVSQNATSLVADDIEAITREDAFHSLTFKSGYNYFHTIIDIPALEQSYEIFYGSESMLRPSTSVVALCLDDEDKKIYKDFDCKSDEDDSFRDNVVATYLNNCFKFDYFSATVTSDAPKLIRIGALISYDYDEATRLEYIKEVKDAVRSLGIDPERYQYHVVGSSEITYRN